MNDSSNSELEAGEGVTIVSPTVRAKYMQRLLDNYARQQWENKELIIVLNRKAMSMKKYERAASKYDNVRVVRVPGSKPLGDCLNHAASMATFPFIAKFDDDDYYGPAYIAEAMRTFRETNADIVGKSSLFFYFPHRRLLLLRKRKMSGAVKHIAGATIMFRRRVLEAVRFGKRRKGSDVQFIRACLRRGFRVYSSSPYNFAAFRRANRWSHTWNVRASRLLRAPGARIVRTKDYKKYVNRENRR